ncbi:EF hand family protein [Pelomyxa schiedti]|nr:EF hand family protein [Pelomyxa schiedti]
MRGREGSRDHRGNYVGARADLSTESGSTQWGVSQLRAAVLRRGTRIGGFLREFDRTGLGRVTTSQFERAVASAGAVVPPDVIAAVAAAFPAQGYDGMVSWRDAAAAIDGVHEGRPQTGEERPTEFSTARARPLSPRGEEDLHRLLARIQEVVKSKNICLQNLFQPFDKMNTGFVTQKQFECAIPFVNSLEQRQLLVRKFGNRQTGDVDYVAFHKMCSAFDTAEALRSRPPSAPKQELTLDDILSKIAAGVRARGLRLKSFFADYDRVRNGWIPESKFLSGLSISLVAPWATQTDMEKIVRSFGSDGQVNYIAFCSKVEDDGDSSFRAVEPAEPVQLHSPPGTPKEDSHRGYSSQDKPNPQKIISRVQTIIASRGINLWTCFSDFDRQSTGRISPPLFRRALCSVGIELSEMEFQLLTDQYYIETHNSVNYVSFIRDTYPTERSSSRSRTPATFVQPNSARPSPIKERPDVPISSCLTPSRAREASRVAMASPGRAYSPSSSRTTNSITITTSPIATTSPRSVTLLDVLARISAFCNSRSINLRDLFKDFDTRRTGAVSRDHFSRSLSQLSLNLNGRELELIAKEFESNKTPGYINYNLFVSALYPAVQDTSTTRSLSSTGIRSEGTPAVQRTLPPSGDNVDKLLQHLRQWSDSQGLLITPFFKIFDQHNRECITREQFSHAFESMGSSLSMAQVALLSSEYMLPDGRVDYISFLKDIESYSPNTGPPVSSRSLSRSAGPKILTIDNLLAKLQQRVISHSINTQDFFKEFDPLRRGIIPQTKFRAVLQLCGFNLTEEELYVIESHFKIDEVSPIPTIDYHSFCASITPSFPERNEQPEDTNCVESRLSQREEDQVRGILTDLKNFVRLNRINLLPTLQDFDIKQEGTVTRAQLLSGFRILRLSCITQQDIELLARKFAHKYRPELVCYRALINALQPKAP